MSVVTQGRGGGGRGLSEALHLEVLGHRQEGGEILLSNVDLTVVHEVEYRHKVRVFDTFQVQEWVVMFEAMEQGSETDTYVTLRRRIVTMIMPISHHSSPEKRGAGGEDELVGLDLLLLARDRHIEKVLLVPYLLEGLADVPLEVVPLKTKFIPRPHVNT